MLKETQTKAFSLCQKRRGEDSKNSKDISLGFGRRYKRSPSHLKINVWPLEKGMGRYDK